MIRLFSEEEYLRRFFCPENVKYENIKASFPLKPTQTNNKTKPKSVIQFNQQPQPAPHGQHPTPQITIRRLLSQWSFQVEFNLIHLVNLFNKHTIVSVVSECTGVVKLNF